MSTQTFQEKALERLRRAKKTASGEKRDKRDESTKRAANEPRSGLRKKASWKLSRELERVDTYTGTQVHDSFEQACERGDVRFVRECLEGARDGGLKLLRRNRLALHLACWSANVGVARELLAAAPWLIHERDSTRATPLMEACLGKHNHVKLRLALVRNLVEIERADVLAKDHNGDTCVHLLARAGNTLMLRALFRTSSRALLALEMRNARGRTPLEVGAQRDDSSPAQERLLAFLHDCLGPAWAHDRDEARRAEDTAAAAQQSREDSLDAMAAASDEAQQYAARISKLCNEQHLAAEAHRQQNEKMYVDAAVRAATGKAHAWLKGQYGANELSALAKSIRKDMRGSSAAAREAADMSEAEIRELAKSRAKDMLLRRKQNEAKSKALTEFRARHPPYESR